MARKLSDDELRTSLEATGKPELGTWLLERCQDDGKLRASLLDLVTPKAHTDVLVGEIRGRIRQAWQLAKRRDGWKMALPVPCPAVLIETVRADINPTSRIRAGLGFSRGGNPTWRGRGGR